MTPANPGIRSLTRRQALLTLAACGAATMGVRRFAAAAVLASGQVPGATLSELATYTGWRTTWDLIVPLRADRAFPRTALLYDRAAGEATLISVNAAGSFAELQRYTGWRKTWEAIVPSGFPRGLGITGLVAYDKSAGALALWQIDQFGAFREPRTHPNWRKSWTAFVPIGTAGLLAYDRGAGYATLFSLDAQGGMQEIRSYNDWRTTWDLLTTGPFTTGAMPSGDLLLYDRTAGQAAGMTLLGNGETVPFANYSGWRRSWASAQGGLFLIQGSGGSGTADLVLYDNNARELEFLDIGPNGAQASLLLTTTPGTRSWTSVTALGPDLLLLYDRTAGTAGFYVTNRAPVTIPTAVPPTPTPPPAIGPIDRVTIRLQQGKGNDWNSYTARSDDPKSGSGRQAYITGVKNTADKRIALIHRDKAGKRTGPVFVKAGEVSAAFNGMTVGGDWEATVTSSQSEAPARIPLEVRYEVR